MNREILFRGKRTDNGEWVYGSLVKMGPAGYTHYFILPDYASAFYDIEVDPNSIGQYTGMDDKNGVKIFEGDIVRAFIPKKCGVKGFEVGFVEFHKSSFSAVWSNFLTYGRNFIGYISDIEIIGNIHDNPELLGGNDGTADKVY